MVPIFIKYSLAINNMWVLYKILRNGLLLRYRFYSLNVFDLRKKLIRAIILTSFSQVKHNLGKNKQTNKQTNKTETKPIKYSTNEFHVALWPCVCKRSQITSSCGKWYTTCSWVCHRCSYHIQSLLKSIGEQTHDNHESTWFNPLHPYIRIHLLYTLLCMFPLVLTRRICWTIKVSLGWRSFPLFSWS